LDPARLEAAAALLLLLLARLSPLVLIAPWLGVRGQPAVLSLALTFGLGLSLWPAAAAAALDAGAGPPRSLLLLAGLLLREALIGLLYALCLALPLLSLGWVGQLAERARGGLPGAQGPLAQLQLFAAVAAFFSLGGHRLSLSVLADSLRSHPPGRLAAPADAAGLALGSAHLVADAFSAAVLMALPVLAAVMLAEVLLSLSLRLSSLLPATPSLSPLRTLLVLLTLWATLAMGFGRLPDLFAGAIEAGAQLLRAL